MSDFKISDLIMTDGIVEYLGVIVYIRGNHIGIYWTDLLKILTLTISKLENLLERGWIIL